MKSAWRFFPWAVAGAIGLVVVVNGGMIYAAVHSFPGKAGEAGFALSNHYDAVLALAENEAALGWSIAAATDRQARPIVTLTGRDGRALPAIAVTGSAGRPLGDQEAVQLLFRETEPGRFVAASALSVPGQWDLTLSISAGEHTMAATRRVIVH